MRPAVAVTALGIAVAAGVPAAWAATRPTAAAGAPVAGVLATPDPPTPPASPPSPVRAAPAVPPQFPDVDRAGWYRFGPAPGEPGNAVLAGHVDDAEQGLGALAALRGIEIGTEVVLTDDAGRATRWRVLGRELLAEQALPLDRIFAGEGLPRVVVVTRGGPFQPELRSYRDDVVVVAEPVR